MFHRWLRRRREWREAVEAQADKVVEERGVWGAYWALETEADDSVADSRERRWRRDLREAVALRLPPGSGRADTATRMLERDS